MSAKTIRGALGQREDDPDNSQAWEERRREVGGDSGMGLAELIKLLEAARRAHEARREYEAVARMLGVEAEASKGDPREVEVLGELARVLEEKLLDDGKART